MRRLINGDEKRYSQMPDITRIEGGKSVSLRLEDVIKNAMKYDLEGLKKAFSDILNNPSTHVSKLKAERYKEDISKIHSVERMRNYITNVYMRGAKLGLS